MDELSRRFINVFQGGFPLLERPYASIAVELDTDETTLISTIRSLLAEKYLSRVGPLYEAVSMGGGLTLAALCVPEKDFDRVAQQLNSLAEIAHNYRREHALNMWFVIATERPEAVNKTIDKIQRLTGLTVYNFPKLQEFYVGLWLLLDSHGGVSTRSFEMPTQKSSVVIDALDRRIIRATQDGLALLAEPYSEVAKQCDCDTASVIERLTRMLDSGVIRRIGAVPNHYRLGLTSNGMSVWDVADSSLDALGAAIGKLDFVSHCYQRPRHLPMWSYNLFAMVHGHNRDEVERKTSEIADILGTDCNQHDVLYSSAILKKSGLRLVA
jgi:DNA-binding Lrp family transcriptional regulator